VVRVELEVIPLPSGELLETSLVLQVVPKTASRKFHPLSEMTLSLCLHCLLPTHDLTPLPYKCKEHICSVTLLPSVSGMQSLPLLIRTLCPVSNQSFLIPQERLMGRDARVKQTRSERSTNLGKKKRKLKKS